jgi:hypothetical protein
MSESRFHEEEEGNETAGQHGDDDRDHVPEWDRDSKNRGGEKKTEEKNCEGAHTCGDEDPHVPRPGSLTLLKEIRMNPSIVSLHLFERHLCSTEFAEVGEGIAVAGHIASAGVSLHKSSASRLRA